MKENPPGAPRPILRSRSQVNGGEAPAGDQGEDAEHSRRFFLIREQHPKRPDENKKTYRERIMNVMKDLKKADPPPRQVRLQPG